jgi:hypothetical protein
MVVEIRCREGVRPAQTIYRFFITSLLLSTRDGMGMEEAGVCSNNARLSLGTEEDGAVAGELAGWAAGRSLDSPRCGSAVYLWEQAQRALVSQGKERTIRLERGRNWKRKLFF